MHGVRSIFDGSLAQHTLDSSFSELKFSFGPMARTVSDLILFSALKGTATTLQVDTTKKYCFGVVQQDSFCELPSAYGNVVTETAELLTSASHRVVSVDIRRFLEIGYQALKSFLSVFRAEQLIAATTKDSEPIVDPLKFLRQVQSLPNFVRSTACWLFSALGRHREAHFLQCLVEPKNIREHHLQIAQKLQLIKEFWELWESLKLDFLITPCGMTVVAPLENYENYLNEDYLIFANALKTCAGVVPTRNTNELETKSYESKYNDSVATEIRRNYVGAVALPVCLQVIARPGNDANCLQGMRVIEELWREKNK